jgi:hypothetical protein
MNTAICINIAAIHTEYKMNVENFMSFRQILFFGLTMSLVMSAAMSAVMVGINIGFNSNFLKAWLPSYGTGFLVSLPFSLFLPPLIQKIIKKLNI